MDEKIAEVIQALGSEGIEAFYVYLIVDTVQMFGAFFLIGWGIKKAWPTFSNFIN